MPMDSFVEGYLDKLRSCWAEVSPQDIEEIVEVILAARKAGKRVFILGNGGSAATASHFASDLSKAVTVPGEAPVAAIALADNAALLTAFANDVGYESVFEEQLRVHLNDSDVVIAISVSGESPNILRALECAKKRGAYTIGMAGCGGGSVASLADRCLAFSCGEFGPVEDVHLTLCHLVAFFLREKVSAERDGRLPVIAGRSAEKAQVSLATERARRLPRD